ncbi:UNVERIFIED_CONTAM: hypothetical protein Sradi_5110200 [Sesamum radiatum]|uniref:Uncharacterized protein n=1 Tax=Sesamum radiatum TaxID=300843 RepID=A0AAW2M1X0_SESRA
MTEAGRLLGLVQLVEMGTILTKRQAVKARNLIAHAYSLFLILPKSRILSLCHIGFNPMDYCMDWRKPLLDYLKEGILPEKEVTRLKSRPARFALLDGILYKHSFSQPYLRCFSTEKARTTLKKIHEGVCGSYIGGMPL